MKTNRKQVHQWIGLSEGGLVDHPNDPGGLTNKGVTQRTYRAFRKAKALPPRSVRDITSEEAHTIFEEQYFRPVWFDELPSGMDYAMADFSVNSGPKQAIKTLQRVLNTNYAAGLAVDGAMGLHTLQAVRRVPVQHEAVLALCNARIAFMKTLRNRKTGKKLWTSFGKGWTRRVLGEEPGIQATDTGVVDRASRLAAGQVQAADRVTQNPGRAKGATSLFEILAALLLGLFGGKTA